MEARSLLILLEERGELRVAAAAGEFDLDAELRLPVAGSAPGQVLEARRPVRLRDLGANLMSQPRSQGTGAAALLVPLVFRGQALGVLVALDPLGEDTEFSGESERVLGSFAASAATAVATAQSVAEDKIRYSIDAAERERGRWARELHDEALQSMGGLRVLLSTARRGGADGGMDELLSQAIERVDHTIAEMRRLIADLRPATLDELGLAAALEALVERLNWGQVLEVELQVDLAYEAGRHPTRLLNQIEDTVYRLVQEGLNNVAKHGGTERATVEVIEDEESLRVLIADDGKRGFDPDEDSDRVRVAGHARTGGAGGRVAGGEQRAGRRDRDRGDAAGPSSRTDRRRPEQRRSRRRERARRRRLTSDGKPEYGFPAEECGLAVEPVDRMRSGCSVASTSQRVGGNEQRWHPRYLWFPVRFST